MRTTVILYIVLLCSMLSTALGQGVNNPVKVETQLLPPHTPYVLDYINGNVEKLFVQLLLTTDANTTELDVKLHMTIQNNNGVRIETNVNPQIFNQLKTIKLTRNIFYKLSTDELRPYFDIRNLVFTGLTAQDYVNNNGKLPDGVYTFCFDAYANRAGQWVNVSNVQSAVTGCKSLFVTYNDPPQLNFPENNSKVASLSHDAPTSQNIVFNWLPRHPASTNTLYQLEIFELPPNYTGNPNIIVQASTPKFKKTVYSTTYSFNTITSDGFLLIPDRAYAYRVKVQPADGSDALSNISGANLFKNDGYSEVFVFNVQGECKLPTDITEEQKSEENVLIHYTPVINAADKNYKVQYRKTGTAVWLEETVNDASSISLSGLKKLTEYEYRLSSAGTTCYGDIVRFTTSDKPDTRNLNCGIPDDVNSLDSTTALAALQPNQTIKVGSFVMVPAAGTSISNGTLSGKGHIGVPLYYNAGLNVNYNNIKVNDKGEMYAGEIITNVGDIKNIIDITNPEDNYAYVDPTTLGGTIKDKDAIKVTGETITITVTKPDGTTETKTYPYTPGGGGQVKDNDNNVYTIDKDGNVTGPVKDSSSVGSALDRPGQDSNSGIVSSTSNLGPALNTSKVFVQFDKRPSQYYGFDNVNTDEVIDGSTTTKVNWKSMPVGNGNMDFVEVDINIKDNQITKEQIKFRTLEGVNYDLQDNKIQLKPSDVAGIQQLYAYYTQGVDNKDTVRVGKLNIVHYETITKKVILIPMNEQAEQSAITDKERVTNIMNTYYSQALVKWEVSIANLTEEITNKSWDINGNGQLDIPSEDELDYYTDEMSALNSIALQKYNKENADDGMLYVFYGIKDNQPGIKAAFPLHGNFGYIFKGTTDMYLALVHELGHGAFKLKHEGASGIENMMELGAESKTYTKPFLSKPQWDSIRVVRTVLAGENTLGDGAAAKVNVNELNDPAFTNTDNQRKKYLTFISPSGYPISFEVNKLSQPGFSFDDDASVGAINQKDFSLNNFIKELSYDKKGTYKGVLSGSLISFIYNGTTYKARFSHGGEIGGFSGYFPVTEKMDIKPYVDISTEKILENYKNNNQIFKVIAGTVCFENNKFNVKIKRLIVYNDDFFKVNELLDVLTTQVRPSAFEFNGYLGRLWATPAYAVELKLDKVKQAIDNAEIKKTVSYVNAQNKNLNALANLFYKDFATRINNCDDSKMQMLQNVTNLINIVPMYYVEYMLDKKYLDGGKISTSAINSLENFYKEFSEYALKKYNIDNDYWERVKRNVCNISDDVNKIANFDSQISGMLPVEAAIDKLMEVSLNKLFNPTGTLNSFEEAVTWGVVDATRKQAAKKLADYFNEKVTDVVLDKIKTKIVTALVGNAPGTAVSIGSVVADVACGALTSIQVYRSFYDESFANTKFAQDYREGVDAVISLFAKETYEKMFNDIKTNNIITKIDDYSKSIIIKKGTTYSNDEKLLIRKKTDSLTTEIFDNILGTVDLVDKYNSQKNIADKRYALIGELVNIFKEKAFDAAGVKLENCKLCRATASLQKMGFVPTSDEAFIMATRGQSFAHAKLQIKVRDELNDFAELKDYNGALVIDFNKAVVDLDNSGKLPNGISGDMKIATIPKARFFSTKDGKKYLCESTSLDVYQESNGNIVIVRPTCFVAGTKVSTKEGFKNIEDVIVGDKVYSYDEAKKSTVLNNVVNVFKRTSHALVKIFAGKDTLQATPEHPFYTNKGWLDAGKLKRGLKILVLSGALLTVDSISAKDTIATVYNFEVENTHSYYVGKEKLLVHNASGYDDEIITNDDVSSANESTHNKLNEANKRYLETVSKEKLNLILKNIRDVKVEEDDFLNILNSNPDIMKAFVNHKLPNNEKLSWHDHNELSKRIIKALDNINASDKIIKKIEWLINESRSSRFWMETDNKAAGITLGWITDFLIENRMESRKIGSGIKDDWTYRSLKNLIGNDIDEYVAFKQVYICLSGDCKAEGTFFIADNVFAKVKDNKIDLNSLILSETKLSDDTNLSGNQNEALNKLKKGESFIIKSSSSSIDPGKGGIRLIKGQRVKANKYIKISGKEEILDSTGEMHIEVSNFNLIGESK